ncbi:DUF2889 domain-containing protein [Amycolatopsis sp.]|uniref:DUF2889 domain-containing protein n=1 Tax=Amycolatopsis sp. TaxID=37632 RepID=UPI002BB556CE|nr:DUF2889 domain-containing protein [Amycolatopsis sp.]HVV08084.1 DUF2889 domain-containing protein [Amycolatopsis sp.]
MPDRESGIPPAPEGVVHRRSIIMDSYPLDDEHFTVVGRLTDQIPWAEPHQQRIHDMTLRVTVHLPDLVITAADAGMSSFPHAECPLIAPAFARLAGISVRRGFSRELRQRLGGVSGCSHLGELARAIGPAVVRTASERIAFARQGKPADPSGGPVPLPLGSCHIWGPEGAGPRKIEAGWVPGSVDRPVPALETFLEN